MSKVACFIFGTIAGAIGVVATLAKTPAPKRLFTEVQHPGTQNHHHGADMQTDAPNTGLQPPQPTDDTPKKICFVFGSNERGQHFGGAARIAAEKHGAIRYQGVGPQGNSYAIPTCAVPTNQPESEIPLGKVAGYVTDFLIYAKQHPELAFMVTAVGCGLARWTHDQIAPLFKDVDARPASGWLHYEDKDNVWFDTLWQPILGNNYNYWGTYNMGKGEYEYTPEFAAACDLNEFEGGVGVSA